MRTDFLIHRREPAGARLRDHPRHWNPINVFSGFSHLLDAEVQVDFHEEFRLLVNEKTCPHDFSTHRHALRGSLGTPYDEDGQAL